MHAPLSDTDDRIAARLLEGYRAMSPTRKLERVAALNAAVRELALADLRRRYPNDTERARQLRLASRWLDSETMFEAFGWDVAREGR